MRNDATITIRVPSEEKEEWEEAAAESKMSLADWLRMQVRAAIENSKLIDSEEDQ